jgi:dolichol-phosphate mannosyltransferase
MTEFIDRRQFLETKTAKLISIVLPTFNESQNIGPLISRTLQALSAHNCEIVVVDDNSPDGTWQIVEQISRNNSRVRLIRRIGEKGLTSAIRRGIREAQGDTIGWMDCDLSMPPELWPDLLESLQNGADIAVGSRYVPGGKDVAHSFAGKTFSQIINLFARLFLTPSIHDFTSGFILSRASIFKDITLQGDYGEYCIDFLYRAWRSGCKIAEKPYICLPREFGDSKTAVNVFGYFKTGWKYVRTVLSLRFSAA